MCCKTVPVGHKFRIPVNPSTRSNSLVWTKVITCNIVYARGAINCEIAHPQKTTNMIAGFFLMRNKKRNLLFATPLEKLQWIWVLVRITNPWE